MPKPTLSATSKAPHTSRSRKPASTVLPHWDTLPQCDRAELASIWQQAFGRPLPPKLYKATILLLLSYRLQELQLGGLSSAVKHTLNARLPRVDGGQARKAAAPLKTGTCLLREWQGREHIVMRTGEGFVYEGKTYRSLSVIARTITGTPWSGPAFFGLNKTTPVRETSTRAGTQR